MNAVDGHIWRPGLDGNFFSSSASSKHSSDSTVPGSYLLGFNASDNYPSNGPGYRYNSRPLCCLVNTIMAIAPLYFVRSGYIADGRMTLMSNRGSLWTVVATSYHGNKLNRPSAYNLGFTIDTISTSNGPSSRYISFPLR